MDPFIAYQTKILLLIVLMINCSLNIFFFMVITKGLCRLFVGGEGGSKCLNLAPETLEKWKRNQDLLRGANQRGSQ